jgi:hypothetical protein
VQSDRATERCLLRKGVACPRRKACESDALLLAAARGGSRTAFDALYERYFSRCFQLARSTLPGQGLAEACTREALAWMVTSAHADGGCLAAEMWKILQSGTQRRRFSERVPCHTT